MSIHSWTERFTKGFICRYMREYYISEYRFVLRERLGDLENSDFYNSC